MATTPGVVQERPDEGDSLRLRRRFTARQGDYGRRALVHVSGHFRLFRHEARIYTGG